MFSQNTIETQIRVLELLQQTTHKKATSKDTKIL